MVHVCMCGRYRILRYWEMSSFYWMMVCCQNVSHAAGNMLFMVCLVLGLFRWGAPFTSVLLFVGAFRPILAHMSWL